jgi:5'-AMP-activated protein kinase regulatory gamma subunit
MNNSNLDEHIVNIKQQVISALKKQTCYDVLPVSFKLIVFDTRLLVKKSLAALLQHGVQSAPLWDSHTQTYAGMLTGNMHLTHSTQ